MNKVGRPQTNLYHSEHSKPLRQAPCEYRDTGPEYDGGGTGHEIGHSSSSKQPEFNSLLASQSCGYTDISIENNDPSGPSDPQLHYNYYFNRWGTLIKIESSNKGKSMIWVANDDNNFAFTGYDVEFVKRFVAVVVGEAANREDAAGIGVVIMNRFDAKKEAGNLVKKDADWPAKLGGEEEYDAIGAGPGHPYDEVMKTSIDEMFRNGLRKGYQEKMEGALSALSKGTRKEVNSWLGTPHFWEGKLPYKDALDGDPSWFTINVKAGMIFITGQAGKSYFFNYTDKDPYLQKRKWP